MDELVDSYGRVHRDLRISVTDRCNFRCTYCMPEEGMAWMPRSEILTFEELERAAALMVTRFGVESIRITGGEPLVRAHLPVLVAKLSALGTDLALTTNGSTLASSAQGLADAGLRRINISIDTFRPERFIELTKRDDLAAVLDGIDAAIAAGLSPVKLNAVVIRGVNDDELIDFARFGRDRGVTPRFIEYMPLDAQSAWHDDAVVRRDEIIERISGEFPLEPVPRTSAPATRFRYADGAGEIGVVASVSDAFCGTCDRVRLTADGQFRNCLFAVDELDLRAMLRSGATDDEVADAIAGNVSEKWAGHLIGQVNFIRPSRSMSQIGG